MGMTRETLAVGRYLSTAGVVVVVAALFRPGRPQHAGSLSSFLSPLLFLSILFTLCWSGSFFKPEYIATAFSLLAFTSYIGKGLSAQKPWLLRTSFLAATAILFKLTAAGALVGIGAHLLWDRRYKEAFRFVGCAVGSVVVVYSCLAVWIGGGIWTMGISANNVGLSLPAVLNYLGKIYLANTLVLIAIAGCIPLITGSRGRRSVEEAIACYFLAAFCLFAFACGRPGSSYNYFVESGVGMALVIPAALRNLHLRRQMQGYYMIGALVVLALMVNLKSLHGIIKWGPEPIDRATVLKKLLMVKIPPGTYVMADTRYVMEVIQSGHAPLINDNFIYPLMVKSGKLPAGLVMKALREGRVSYVLLAHSVRHNVDVEDDWWPRDALEYIEQRYSCEPIMSSGGNMAAVGCAPVDGR